MKRIVVYGLAAAVLIVHTFEQIMEGEFPFHLCNVMAFFLPFVVLFNLVELKTSVYAMSILGGILSLVANEFYFDWQNTFMAYESLITHFLLILIPLLDIYLIKDFRFERKRSWQVPLGMVIMICWAVIGDIIYGAFGIEKNFMYLKVSVEVWGWYLFGFAVYFFLLFHFADKKPYPIDETA
ncbi:MAG: YwaF family protein [Christensenellaceae bacterium]|nr:YwaF family protein [Christensenellaceae bacterium]